MNTSWRKFQNSVKNIPAVQVWEILATRGPEKNFLRLALIKCFTKKIYLQEHLPIYVIFCAIWYQLYHLKYVRNTHRGVLLLVKLQTFSNASQWNLQAFMVKFDVSLSKKIASKRNASVDWTVGIIFIVIAIWRGSSAKENSEKAANYTRKKTTS